ncbi:glycosyltransferase family 2 protein [Vicingaceae bacterium]|nr:glycosyltransferase family 2 protein [Vicingaceae bacterium]MDC1451713.1 glycosyltransferase family 2 protein [Vicingaceae bacterium]
MIQKLSIIIPAFNEEKTIAQVLDIISKLKLVHNIEKEILVINDFSSDRTRAVTEEFITAHPESGIKLFNQKVNQGKGAALHYGIEQAIGDYLIPQDADLELDPNDINKLLEKAIEEKIQVVYGSRFLQAENPNKNASFFANQILTKLSNLFSGWRITDMETCYKLIDSKIAKALILKEKRFGFEPEITAKLAKVKGIKYGEVPVAYEFRTYEEGKKIGWQDGVKAIFCIVKYSF